ncbi:MAG: D-alanyl-D-alanine carboxypeptidase [Desulfovibrionaceae bacterium]|nr:D-alanyl-D-alanine carboxypeptidase [Desulfovibrionaceae bacterium]
MPVRAALLYNMTTGQILYQHNANVPIPPASLTKVMTLFLAFDAIKQGRLSLNKRIKISRLASRTGGSSMHLRFGERVPLMKLIIGTAVASGNDAAMAVAETVNANLAKFVKLMNDRARALGMRQTRFCNPTGLPAPAQITTVADMLKLALAYLHKHPQALTYHNIATFSHGGHLLSTTNPLLGAVCGVNGLKTGWTTASGYNIIVTAQRAGTRLLLVVMGGRSRVSRDFVARKLLEAGFKNSKSPKEVRTAFLSHKPKMRRTKKASRG